jgi:hypothetical protein
MENTNLYSAHTSLATTLPIVTHLITAYKLWHSYLPNIPKDSRYTLGTKIDALFIETTEPIFIATYLNKEQKLPYLRKAAANLDLVKFFLQILWEIQALDNKKYIALSEKLDEIGRMLGGWMRQLSQNTHPAEHRRT